MKILDEKYINKAASLLGREDLLKSITLKHVNPDGKGGGSKRLDNIWDNLERCGKHFEIFPLKTILLYDCDTEKENKNVGNLYKRKIIHFPENPINKGIENLFSNETIIMAKQAKDSFINEHSATQRKIRGKVEIIPEIWEVDKDEKMNLCNWICDNGKREHFTNFHHIFSMIESIIHPTALPNVAKQAEEVKP